MVDLIPPAWVSDPVFGELADAIASDRLVVYTGSGISSGLARKDGPMPSWKNLLNEIALLLPLSDADRSDIINLLRPTHPSGIHLIEAASILEQSDEEGFNHLVRAKLTPAPLAQQNMEVVSQQNERHDSVINLVPRGIVTLNIDRQHASALNRHRLTWLNIDPTKASSEEAMREWISDPSDKQFLLEAHGSLQSKIVFTHRAYRELLEKNPVYRAFLGNLFINYRLLFLGFGLTDLDFDEFIHQTALTFGESPQRHIVVRKTLSCDEENSRKVHYRRRFGFHFLDVPKYDDVWIAIQLARSHCGPELQQAIDLCVSNNWLKRRQGHRALGSLGASGSSVAIRVLTDRIDIERGDEHDVCEYIYSLKYLAPMAHESDKGIAKAKLFYVLEQSNNTEFIAHAITALESYLALDDLTYLEQVSRKIIGRRLTTSAGYADPDCRVPVYLESAILRLRASVLSHESHILQPRPGPPLIGRV